ncbi:MAG TPA: twin-arginine translocation signal domain-containing protein [Pyrinomonadaceae bacterium]|nr:twin-arginine translocation signal domain-containing protein [Pyrinomonadaceae bacterium]
MAHTLKGDSMHITRRNFLHTLGTAVAVATVGITPKNVFGQKQESSNLFPIPAEVYSEPLYSMTAKQLKQFIGSDFTATSSRGETIDLVLTEVNAIERLPNSAGGFYGECFSLIFENKRKRSSLKQDTYEMGTTGMAPFSALVVPTDRLAKRNEVIVNHLSR